MNSKEAINNIEYMLKRTDKLIFYKEEIDIIEQELKKPQELYNIIKKRRDNARLIREEHARKQDISDEEKSEICAEICTYNDVLLLMENMFVINMFEGLENE